MTTRLVVFSVAGAPRRAGLPVNARGKDQLSDVGPSSPHARDVYAKTDGGVEESKGSRVRPPVLELFNFATDVDSGQRAEIRIMQGMLDKPK